MKGKLLITAIAVLTALVVAPMGSASGSRTGSTLTSRDDPPRVPVQEASTKLWVIAPDDLTMKRPMPQDHGAQFGTRVPSSGFDWIDALIGGVTGLGTALLLMGVAFRLVQYREGRGRLAGSH